MEAPGGARCRLSGSFPPPPPGLPPGHVTASGALPLAAAAAKYDRSPITSFETLEDAKLRLDMVDAALNKGVGGVPLSELSDTESAALCCALQRVGKTAVYAGDLPVAARSYARMLDLAQARGRMLWEGAAHANIACVARMAGDEVRAKKHFERESAAAMRRGDYGWEMRSRAKAEQAENGPGSTSASDGGVGWGSDAVAQADTAAKLSRVVALARQAARDGAADDAMPVLLYLSALSDACGRRAFRAHASAEVPRPPTPAVLFGRRKPAAPATASPPASRRRQPRRTCAPPLPPLVLSGHAASLTPY